MSFLGDLLRKRVYFACWPIVRLVAYDDSPYIAVGIRRRYPLKKEEITSVELIGFWEPCRFLVYNTQRRSFLVRTTSKHFGPLYSYARTEMHLAIPDEREFWAKK